MLINKNELPLVELESMNKVHLEDVDIVNTLSILIDSYCKNPNQDTFNKINSQYELWYNHTINHFKGEEDMMIQKNFFAYPMHKREHDNTLHIMDTVFVEWKLKKDIQILQKYIQNDLIEWLINHILTMDTITANFLKTGITPCHSCG